MLQMRDRSKSVQGQLNRYPHEGGLSIQEAHELIEVPIDVQVACTMVPSDHSMPALQLSRRKLPTCRKCREEGHRSDHCPNRLER